MNLFYSLFWNNKTRLYFPLKPRNIIQKHLPETLHIYLFNIRLQNPKSSFGFFESHHIGLLLHNHPQHLDFVIKCTECRASLPPRTVRHSNLTSVLHADIRVFLCQNEFRPGRYLLCKKGRVQKTVYNRLTTSSSVTLDLFVLCLHLYYMEANVQNNLFVFRGITQ